jgi:hypothetical protein
MARVLSYGYTPTTSATRSVALQDLDFANDFAKMSDERDEAIVTNVDCPVAYPETMRFMTEDVANIYRGTGIDPSLYSNVKQGKKILVTLRDTWKISDSADASYEVALPLSGNLTLRVPNSGDIATSDLYHFCVRLISGIFQETGNPDGTRIVELLRGVQIPSSLR